MKFLISITLMGLLAPGTPSQEPSLADLACVITPRVAEHGNLSERDERALLDNLALQFGKARNHVIYFLIYAGLRSCKDEARLRALRAKTYLVQRHSVPPESRGGIPGGRSRQQAHL